MPPGLRYPDRRSSFANVPQWSIPAGTGREDNKGQRTPSETLATRTIGTWEQNEKGEHVYKPGSKNPRTDFRVKTAPQPVESHPEQPQSPPNPSYERNESLTKSLDDQAAASPIQVPYQSVSSGTLSHVLANDGELASPESQPVAYTDGQPD